MSPEFHMHDRVRTRSALATCGVVIADAGQVGEIVKVLRDEKEGLLYQVAINGRVLQIGEASLEPEFGQGSQVRCA